MNLPPLIKARLIKRYKRFLADVELENGDVVVAHCANSGSMLGLKDEGNTVYLSANTNPKAKLDWRWELVDVNGTLVNINTSRPNHIVEEGILDGTIVELQGYGNLRREVKYGAGSRIDLLLEQSSTGPDLCYVEVKSVTLAEGDQALFPDAVTARGAKHLDELIQMIKNGHRAVMVYLVGRGDCTSFAAARDIDPHYASKLDEAMTCGVEALAYDCDITTDHIRVRGPVPIAK